MLIFIVPLKSVAVATSWERVSQLLSRTVASACAQISPAFRVVVACHELPEGDISHPQLEYIQVEHAPPLSSTLSEMRADMQRKRLIGLRRSLEYSPSHVMFLDSDDLVSNRLAEFVEAHSSENGWYMRTGYFYCEQQKFLHLERRRFHQWSGSAHIVRPEHLDFAIDPNDRLHFDHRQLAQALEQRGTPLRPLPFKGAVYSISHGDNLNDYEHILWPEHPILWPLRRIIHYRAITPRIRKEFGLYPAAIKD
ncbi:MAG TPA: hypothetical protein VI566_04150 [Xanthomonadales bacterium]|nr:hypothetical protein [Xanthomonadales bacterium]